MSKIVLAYAILSSLPIGLLAAMIRSIGLKGAAQVMALIAGGILASFALSWAITIVMEAA